MSAIFERRPPMEEPHSVFYAARQALRRHATGGNMLLFATVAALIVANIPGVNNLYNDFWTQEIRLQVGDFNIFSHGGHPMTLLAFINDALMAVFFFTIGLEIKREVLVGELSSFKKALLPIMGAIGGMALPVAIFFLFSYGTDYAGGVAIPMATDIAFSLGLLAMLGDRIPLSLKIFLTTLAVVDDIGGIIVIATCYSDHIALPFLLSALGLLVLLALGAAWLKIQNKIFYLFFGGVVWFLFLNSGVHPTIAGVLIAFCIPASPVYAPRGYIKQIRGSIAHFRQDDDDNLDRKGLLSRDQMNWLKEIESASDKVISPLQDLEDLLHPVVNFLIIPIFAFANAGICLIGLNPATVFEGVSLAVICGLVAGKFSGIMLFSWLTVRLGLAPMPDHTDWKMMAGTALLGGIGFTVSLFVANLSFASMGDLGADFLGQAKLGIVVGSLIAGCGGMLLLRKFARGGGESEAKTSGGHHH